MTTITLPNDLAEQLAQQAHARKRSVEALAIEYIETALHDDRTILDEPPLPPIEDDSELLALVARIKATPPNPANIIPPKGSLADVLRALEAVDAPDYDVDAEIAAFDAAEAELKALDRANDIAEGRG